MDIQVIGTTLFSMSVRNTIMSDAWTIRDNELVNFHNTIFIPIWSKDITEEQLALDTYGCTLCINDRYYSVSTVYYAEDENGDIQEYSF